MILSFISKKGGVSKTTSAVHVASYLARRGPTLLIDGDDTRSATLWASGGHLPFTVLSESDAGKRSGDFEHVVIDTEGGLGDSDIVSLARQSDLVVLPTPPSTLSLSAVLETADVLRSSGKAAFRVMLTIVPPHPSTKAEAAREYLTGLGIPMLESQIRRSEAFEEASAQGVTVSALKNVRARIAGMDYESAVREMMAFAQVAQ